MYRSDILENYKIDTTYSGFAFGIIIDLITNLLNLIIKIVKVYYVRRTMNIRIIL